MVYYTSSGRGSKVPEKYGAMTSQGVVVGTSSRVARSEHPSQPRSSGAARNTEMGVSEFGPWTAAAGRVLSEQSWASRYQREKRSRRSSGATSTSPDPDATEWTEADERTFQENLRAVWAKGLAPTGSTSGPSPDVVHVRAEAGPRGSDNDDVGHVDRSSRVKSTPQPRSHASQTHSSIGNEAEGGNRKFGVKSEKGSPDTVTVSGRTVAVPPWVRDRSQEYRNAWQKEASSVSTFPRAPMLSINVEPEHPSFRTRFVRVDKKGSPIYHYGSSPPERRPLPRVLVKGTPTNNETSQEAEQTTRGFAPKSPLAKVQPRPSTSRDDANLADSGWLSVWKPAENILRSVVDSIMGEKRQTSVKLERVAPPPPPPKDPKYRGSSRVESDDEQYFTVDTEWERQISAYRTSPSGKATSPLTNKSTPNNTHENSGSEIGMTNRIPSRKKGKRARFVTPVAQPTSLPNSARNAEAGKRKRRAELEAKMKRMEGEYEAAIHRLRILESEQTDLEEAEELQSDPMDDALVTPPSQGKFESEGVSSAARNSIRKDDAPTTPGTDLGRTLSSKLIDKKKTTANKTNPSRKEGESMRKGGRESERKTRCREESADNGEPQDVAMRTAKLIFEMQKEMIEELVRERLERLQPFPTTHSLCEWRGAGFLRKRSQTPSTMGEASTMSRANSMKRSVTLVEDSSESSEKDTETEEEPRSAKRRKESVEEQEARERKAAVEALAIGKPDSWSGKPVYDKFDRWVDQVDEWRRNHGLSEYAVITTMGFLLTESAKDWYNAMVRGREHEWTLEELTSALFTDMFPPDIDSSLRAMFISAEQGKNSLREWYKHVMKLAWRVPNLSEHDVRRQFMEGANDWLQEKWAGAGYTPEDPKLTLQTLMESGQRFERARAILISARWKMASDSEESTPSTDGNEDRESQTDQDESTSQEEVDGELRTQGQDPVEHQDPSSSSEESANLRKGLTAKERVEMLSEGRCFQYRQRGHIARDCPSRRENFPMHKGRGKQPSIYNGALRIVPMKLKAGGPIIRSNMIEPLTANSVIASEGREREGKRRTHQLQEARESVGLIESILYAHLRRQLEGVPPDHEWQRHRPSRPHHFMVESIAEGVFNVRDTWCGWSSYLATENLFDPSFKVSKWVDEMKENAPIEIDLRQSTPIETVNQSDGNETSSGETSKGDIPELGDVDDLPTSYDDSDIEDESSAEEPGSSTPELSTESDDSGSGRENQPGAKNRHPIGCDIAQASKMRAKPKTWDSKSKKTLWESLDSAKKWAYRALSESDSSTPEMGVIRGGGGHRSSVPDQTINPQNSPREERHTPKLDKRQLVEREPAREYDQKNSSKKEEYRTMMMRRRAGKASCCKTMIWLDEADHGGREMGLHRECNQGGYPRKKEYELEIGKGGVNTAPASHHRHTFNHDTSSYGHASNGTAIEWERRVNYDDQEPLRTIQGGGISTKENPASTKPVEQGVESRVLSKELLLASYIYSGMMRAYANSTSPTFDTHIYFPPNPQPSYLPLRSADLHIDGLIGCISDESTTGSDSLVTDSSKIDFKDEEFEDLANQIDVLDR